MKEGLQYIYEIKILQTISVELTRQCVVQVETNIWGKIEEK